MPPARRLWDSCIVIGYLAGYPEFQEQYSHIIAAAKRGEVEIVVSALAMVETAFLTGYSDKDAEDKIREFFGRQYVIPVQVDSPIATIARDLVRRHRYFRPEDATHLATAMQLVIPLIETNDPGLLELDTLEGTPRINIRKPFFEGGTRLTLI